MKKLSLLAIILLLSFYAFSQSWMQSLPQEKVENGTLTFFEIQEAFNAYWEPHNVENGYYMVNGEKVKAPGYKQYKRWEWYWRTRINPKTGEFPDKTALDEFFASAPDNRSTGGTWSSLGPNTSSGGYAGLGRLNCVAFHPTDASTYYVGAASGGIWKTTDDGVSWEVLNDTVPVIGVSDIIMIESPAGNDTLYIATGDRDGGSMWSLGGQQSNDNNSIGVLKSINGGDTWSTTGLTFTASQKVRVNRLLMDPTSNYQTIYAATTDGVYKTTNAGVSWSQISTNAFIDMEFKPGDPTTIYGATEGWSNAKIFRSTNSGSSWSQVASYSGRRIELAVSADESGWVYALVAANNGGLLGVYRSTDSGANYSQVFSSSTANLLNWSCTPTTQSGGQGSYDLVINVDPTDADVVYVGGVNLWKSTDGGSNFNIANHWSGGGCPAGVETVHADKHFLAFQNGTSTLFEANDGGLYRTTDGGSTWTHLSSGMAISQIYRMGVGQTQDDEVIIGLQDNGTKALLSGVWEDVIGGDGFECIVDYTDEDIQYGALYYGSVYKTTDYWWNSTNITGSIPGGAWCTPYIMDPVDNNTLYIGTDEVYKTTNGGSNWSAISNNGGSNRNSLAISASDQDYIYTATWDDIYRTTDGGGPSQSWTNINSNLPLSSSNITYISVKNDDPDHVWVSMGQYNSHGVYETTNGGTSWTSISNGLPSLPVMCVIQNTQYTAGVELYAATDVGVYVKRDAADWVAYNDGLPNVVVTELEIYYDSDPNDSKLYAATYGRGVWESDLYNPSAAPQASFTSDVNSGLPPLTVNFTDQSSGTITDWMWYFGDGNTSTTQNPQHIYNNPGLYTVSLVVTGPGGSDSTAAVDYINVLYNSPTASFSGTPTSGYLPLDVQFTDLSIDTVNAWTWYFGDGNTSTDQNPQHTYNTTGLFTVSLVVVGPGGSDSTAIVDYIDVSYTPPTSDFEGDPTSGIVPLDVQFTDLSTDSVNTWQWYFGDGNTSTLQDPEHTYDDAGLYTVSLVVTGPGGSDSLAKSNYINVTYPEPVANFVGDPISGNAPLEVQFSDMTYDTVNTWNWDFGDGGSSSEQNPLYTYTDYGTYTVSLTVSGPGGSDTETKTDYIGVFADAPTADFTGDPTAGGFPLEVNFTDESTGEVTDWTWYFGDGNTSTETNPIHTYDVGGIFTVSLRVDGPGGFDSTSKIDYIEVIVGLDEVSSDGFKVYPNPFKDEIKMEALKDVRKIILSDASGSILKDIEVAKDIEEYTINTEAIKPGLYFCRIIQTDGGIVLVKLIK